MIQLKDQKLGENVRKSFSRTRFNLELPDLVEIQTRSYAWFLREGLTEVLHEVSPIADFSEFVQIKQIRADRPPVNRLPAGCYPIVARCPLSAPACPTRTGRHRPR